jgi:hypothetical protein
MTVDIRSTEAPGLKDLLFFFAGVGALLLFWGVLLVGGIVP